MAGRTWNQGSATSSLSTKRRAAQHAKRNICGSSERVHIQAWEQKENGYSPTLTPHLDTEPRMLSVFARSRFWALTQLDRFKPSRTITSAGAPSRSFHNSVDPRLVQTKMATVRASTSASPEPPSSCLREPLVGETGEKAQLRVFLFLIYTRKCRERKKTTTRSIILR